MDRVTDYNPHEPAAHPRLGDARVVAELTSDWRRGRRLRVDSVLAPGLAAELAAFVPLLHVTPQLDQERDRLCWRCLLAMPTSIEPQYPACLYRLGSWLEHGLPALVSAIVGYPVAARSPGLMDVHVFRKGCYMNVTRAPAPAGSVEFMLGVTGARWPASWGGHIEALDEHDVVVEERALGWDTLDLFAHSRTRVPLISHHVYGVALCGVLLPGTGRTLEAAE